MLHPDQALDFSGDGVVVLLGELFGLGPPLVRVGLGFLLRPIGGRFAAAAGS